MRLFYVGRSTSNSRQVHWPLVALLVAFLLLLAIEPETRVFLMFIDAVGLDFFLLLLGCQFRDCSWILRDRALNPVWRRLNTWGPFPMDCPTRQVMTEFPYLSACAVVGLVVSVSFLLATSLVIVLPVTVLIYS